jgi:hypothetical protein
VRVHQSPAVPDTNTHVQAFLSFPFPLTQAHCRFDGKSIEVADRRTPGLWWSAELRTSTITNGGGDAEEHVEAVVLQQASKHVHAVHIVDQNEEVDESRVRRPLYIQFTMSGKPIAHTQLDGEDAHQLYDCIQGSKQRIYIQKNGWPGKLSVLNSGTKIRVACAQAPDTGLVVGQMIGTRWEFVSGARVNIAGVGEGIVKNCTYADGMFVTVRMLTGQILTRELPDERVTVVHGDGYAIRDAFIAKVPEDSDSDMLEVRYIGEKRRQHVHMRKVMGLRPPLAHLRFDLLSDDVLACILAHVDPADLGTLASVSRALRTAARFAVPGLNLTLYAHQRKALDWMIARENKNAYVWNGAWDKFWTSDGTPFYVNACDGVVSREQPPPVLDTAGGMLCDEPGMGKTITILSLVLKTLRRPRSSSFPRNKNSHSKNTQSNHNGDINIKGGKALRRVSRMLQPMCIDPQELLASDATLIIVPATLVEHWEFQIRTHTKKDLLTVCAVTRPSEMPDASVLASAHVVITTFDVL